MIGDNGLYQYSYSDITAYHTAEQDRGKAVNIVVQSCMTACIRHNGITAKSHNCPETPDRFGQDLRYCRDLRFIST